MNKGARIDSFAMHYQDSVFQETCLLQGCEFTVAMRSVKYLAIYEIQILSAIVNIRLNYYDHGQVMAQF